MLRSMYSGISGMKNFQTKLDVIGNNISNVNTYGFKKGRTVFKDMISQTMQGASAGTDARGGINPKQVGLGSQMAAIDTIHNAGALQSTGRGLDLAIAGDGFFQMADMDGNVFNNPLYTRAGNFYMDSEGSIVNADGKYLVGAAATVAPGGDYPLASAVSKDPARAGQNLDSENNHIPDLTPVQIDGVPQGGGTAYGPLMIPTDAQSMNIDQHGNVTFVDSEGALRWAGQLVLAKFPNTAGLEKVGGNYFRSTTNTGDPLLQTAQESGIGSIESGYLEMSNVDLSEEFTEMIVAQRGFQANTRIITTSDEILQELMNLKR
ncbi:flagellar basal body rod protein FlgG [Indiicoccus explosivorum]|uniref:flagellar basal body rod protein FlgG n=1 Tax=Indiicoccus explosivorum TaxID=1917864 RepID=UPI000B43A823|nr:flagellar basal body rod protein FlgG [Indiicoccus explosivorum]